MTLVRGVVHAGTVLSNLEEKVISERHIPEQMIWDHFQVTALRSWRELDCVRECASRISYMRVYLPLLVTKM